MVAGPAELMRPIRRRGMKTLCGAPLAPFNAMLALRGLKTLALRMERHCANALAVARALAHHPAVAEVHYVGLEDHPQHMLSAAAECGPSAAPWRSSWRAVSRLAGQGADGVGCR